MCGLLAASGKIDPSYLMALGCFNSKRGTDSAGVAWLGQDGKPVGEKIAAHPIAAFSHHLREGIIKGAESGLVIGHTRAATQGDVNEKNAHPFLMDGIAFAHNGIIYNDHEFGEYEVDSQALIHGIKSKDFSKYKGSIALIWIESGKLHAYRHGNPLYRGLKDGGLYLASEESCLKELGCENTRELSDAHLYIISGGGIIKSSKIPENATTNATWANSNEDGYYGGHGIIQPNTPNKPRPQKRERCVECNHKGKAHNKVNGFGNWACWAKSSPKDKKYTSTGTCPCNCFISKRKEVMDRHPIVVAGSNGVINNPQSAPYHLKCKCTHTVRAHFMRGNSLTCNAPDCPCMTFEKAPVVVAANNARNNSWNDEWADLNKNVQCECTHELEYHRTAGSDQCAVANCACSSFWPSEKESIIPPDSMSVY